MKIKNAIALGLIVLIAVVLINSVYLLEQTSSTRVLTEKTDVPKEINFCLFK